jgi:hypothetical protein
MISSSASARGGREACEAEIMPEAAAFDAQVRRILDAARERAVTIRLLGGLAIWMRSPEKARTLFNRDYADIDLAARRSESAEVRSVLEALAYLGDEEINMFQGHRRLYFTSPDSTFHIDVFLDVFEMSHTIDLTDRLAVEDGTIPAADLLLTKLQIAEINEKDIRDTAMLLLSHAPNDYDGPGMINMERVRALCSADWGLYTTVSDNLARTRALIPALVESSLERTIIMQRLDRIGADLVAAPKTRAWRLRARLGRRKRWYMLPDAVE